MKWNRKKIAASTIAASLVLGGGLATAFHNQAFAATDSTTTQSTAGPNASTDSKSDAGGFIGKEGRGKHGHGGPGFGYGGGDLIQETATILGVDQTAVTDQLTQGKTLAQAAEAKGLAEADYLQKLADAVTKKIDAAVTAGTITQAQADKAKTGLSDRLKREVEETAQGEGGGRGGHGERGFGPFGDSQVLAQILGITQADLKTELGAGKSIAEIAQAKGIAEDQLIAKLKDGMTDQLKQYVERKGMGERPQKQPTAASTPSQTDSPAVTG